MDLVTAIENWRSIRRYETRPVPKETLLEVVSAARDALPLRPEIGIRWYTVWSGAALDRGLDRPFSPRATLGPAPHYVLAVSEKRPGYLENLGFCMQQMMLAATAHGLGTCWIRGRAEGEAGGEGEEDTQGDLSSTPKAQEEMHLHDTFDQDALRGLTPDIAPDEEIVALTPMGYPEISPRARMARHLARWGTDQLGTRLPLRVTASRDTWAVPWAGQDETVDRVLSLAALAPSWGNTQPWHFVVGERSILAAVLRPADDERARHHRLDGGIAMCHFYLAAHASGRWPAGARWRALIQAELAPLRTRYGVPPEYDMLALFPAPEDT